LGHILVLLMLSFLPSFGSSSCVGIWHTNCRYRWMTYGEVGAGRTAIGSGLVQNGIPKASI
jgi:hypothetical protein